MAMRPGTVTLRDVLLIVFLVVPLSVLALYYLMPHGHPREMARRAVCGTNLMQIGKALCIYQASYRDSYPWAVDARAYTFTNTAPMRLGGYDGLSKLDPGQSGTRMSVEGKDNLHILENLSLLLEENFVNWPVFRCPSVSGVEMNRLDPSLGNKKYGFFGRARPGDPGTYFIDYAMHWGYDNSEAAEANKAPLNDVMDPQTVVLADQHGRSMQEFQRIDKSTDNDGAGYSHYGECVNSLFAGTNVGTGDSVRAGWNKNNLYLRDLKGDASLDPAATTQAVPVNRHDSVLVNAAPVRP